MRVRMRIRPVSTMVPVGLRRRVFRGRPADQKPALSLTKVATEQADSVGDVINYTIVATNTGNVTLASVTVADRRSAVSSAARRTAPRWPGAR